MTKQPMILAVDDDADNLLLLTEVLRLFDCYVITANDAKTALLTIESKRPDLVLLDIMLPDLNGIKVIEQIKLNPQTRDIPLIAVTALARDEDRDRICASGCNDYISKPYMIEDMEAIVRRYLPWILSVA